MTDINKIREAVGVLSQLTDSEWEKINKILYVKSETTEQQKGELVVCKTKEELSYDVTKKVTELLKIVGVPAHLLGYEYLRRAILLQIENPEKYVTGITKVLYPKIAQEFKTTGSKTERAIRHAIEVSWKRGNSEVHNKIFGYSISEKNTKPTNAEAISCFVDYVKMYML